MTSIFTHGYSCICSPLYCCQCRVRLEYHNLVCWANQAWKHMQTHKHEINKTKPQFSWLLSYQKYNLANYILYLIQANLCFQQNQVMLQFKPLAYFTELHQCICSKSKFLLSLYSGWFSMQNNELRIWPSDKGKAILRTVSSNVSLTKREKRCFTVRNGN